MDVKFDDNIDPKTAHKVINDNLSNQFKGIANISKYIENFNNEISSLYESCVLTLLKIMITAFHYKDKIDDNDERTKKSYHTLINNMEFVNNQLIKSFSKLTTTADIANEILQQIPKDNQLIESIVTSNLSEKAMMDVIKRELESSKK